jgi:hypothetical protein
MDEAAAVRMLTAIEAGGGRPSADRYLARLETGDTARGKQIDGYADQVLTRCDGIVETIILPRVLRLAARRAEDQNHGGAYVARHVGRHEDCPVSPGSRARRLTPSSPRVQSPAIRIGSQPWAPHFGSASSVGSAPQFDGPGSAGGGPPRKR